MGINGFRFRSCKEFQLLTPKGRERKKKRKRKKKKKKKKREQIWNRIRKEGEKNEKGKQERNDDYYNMQRILKN